MFAHSDTLCMRLRRQKRGERGATSIFFWKAQLWRVFCFFFFGGITNREHSVLSYDLQGNWKGMGLPLLLIRILEGMTGLAAASCDSGSMVATGRDCRKDRSTLDDQALWYDLGSHLCYFIQNFFSISSNFANYSISCNKSLPAFARVHLVSCK